MTKRLTTLTDAQRDAIPAWTEQWIAHGLSTEPADRERVEDGIRRCYQYADLPWHGNVIWVGSPLTVALAGPIAACLPVTAGVAAVRTGVGAGVWDGVAVSMRAGVGGDVAAAGRDSVAAAVRAGVAAGVRIDVRDSMAAGVAPGLRVSVAAGVRDSVAAGVGWNYRARGTVRDGWDSYLGGRYWCNWLAWTSFFRDVCHVELPGDLWDRDRAYADAQSAGWWWPHNRYVIVCDTPDVLEVEFDGTRWGRRLHSATGPAVAYPDGWQIHALHGVRVPAELIEGRWTVADALRHNNQEVRRVALEHIGWDHVLADGAITLIDEQPDPGNPGRTLRLCTAPDDLYNAPVRLLLVTNASPDRDGTTRRYGLTVPADMTDAITAAGWTYGVPRETYASLGRRT